MSEEPSLPRLPGVSWDELSQSFSRKRDRPQRSQQFNSSDPAVFSSDDDPGLDNYVDGRRKKRYVGSWFQQQPASSDSTFSEASMRPKTKAKREFSRQVDSGVYLGSDGTESEDMLDELLVPHRPRLPQLEQRSVRRVSEAESVLRERIRRCIEKGDESLDAMDLDLEEISNETIRPLSQLSCIPAVAKDVAFEQKEPELKIYLSMNRLARIPGALFDLSLLTTLSLRANNLEEIPPAISKLCNLQELNVSQNRLRYLPAEFLDLIDSHNTLKTFNVHPNPLLQPDQLPDTPDKLQLLGRLEKPDWIGTDSSVSRLEDLVTRHLARSPLQHASSRGVILSKFNLPLDATRPVPVETTAQIDRDIGSSQSTLDRPSRVPSLYETALRACYRSDELPLLPAYIPEELGHLRDTLDRAVRQKEEGGLTCSRCRRMLVVPPLEWIEWRQMGLVSKIVSSEPDVWGFFPAPMRDEDIAVPFLHRACSWQCGPDSQKWPQALENGEDGETA